MKVRLLTAVKYPAAWVMNGPRYEAGEVVPVVEANNQPGEGKLWIATPELDADPYGILLEPGDYEVVED